MFCFCLKKKVNGEQNVDFKRRKSKLQKYVEEQKRKANKDSKKASILSNNDNNNDYNNDTDFVTPF